MAEPALRLLRLAGLLQRQPNWSGKELADRLEVDPRTVRRDVEKLRALGFEISGTPGNVGGYRLGGGSDVPPLIFEDDEAMAIAVVLGTSATAAVPGIERSALTALNKLDRLLPPRLQTQLAALRAATVPLISPTELVSVESLIELARACDSHQLASFDYLAQDDRESHRRVEPHWLVATDWRWYLVAYDLDREDWRTFRVDRISHMRVVGQSFTAREVDDPAQLVAQGITQAPYRHRAVIAFELPATDVARWIPTSVGIVERDGDTSRVEIRYDDLDWVAGYLIGLGLIFEVLEPDELRGHLVTLGRRLARVHRAG